MMSVLSCVYVDFVCVIVVMIGVLFVDVDVVCVLVSDCEYWL